MTYAGISNRKKFQKTLWRLKTFARMVKRSPEVEQKKKEANPVN